MRSVRARTSRSALNYEHLEDRLPLSAAHASLDAAMGHHLDAARRSVGSAFPSGLTPDETRTYYGFDQVSFGGTAADGAGQTIAIVVARNNPRIVDDLTVFDETFGLPHPPSFQVVNQNGGTKLPKNNAGWASESALDVEWAHAIAPGASILLIEAKNDSMSSFITAIDYARHVPGVTVVSVSASSDEWKAEAALDSVFTTPPGHENVSFVFAAGDDGGTAEYPSSSPNVLSVGGTKLKFTSSSQPYEVAWSSGGGGASKFEGVPSNQDGLGLTSRGTPDVAYNADPFTGYSVFDSYGSRGWQQFGGTSAGTPQWAALIAIANQGRELAGKTPLANAQAALYVMPSGDFHDIVTGDNKSFDAAPGYDLATGLGSPIADRLIPDLVAFDGSTEFTVGLPPAAVSHRKSKHHFSAGALSMFAAADRSSSVSVATLQQSSIADSASPLASNELAAPTPVSSPTVRASSRFRIKLPNREKKETATSQSNEFVGLDAYFEKLGRGVAAG